MIREGGKTNKQIIKQTNKQMFEIRCPPAGGLLKFVEIGRLKILNINNPKDNNPKIPVSVRICKIAEWETLNELICHRGD